MFHPIPSDTLDTILARLACEQAFAFFETTRFSEENSRSYLFLHPHDRLLCHSTDDVGSFFDRAEKLLREGNYLAGWFDYEFGYLTEPALNRLYSPQPARIVADFGVYGEPYIFDHASGLFAGRDVFMSSEPGETSSLPRVRNLRLNLSAAEYLEKIERIKRYIECGDTYQVNFTLKILFDFTGDPAQLYKMLRRNQSVSYGAYIRSGTTRVLSLSPELFFRKKGDICMVRPMKGTMGRGRTTAEDDDMISRLRNDAKNRSENVMIVDLLRNDLGRLSHMGGVSVRTLFDVETYETLHQMTSSITGQLRRDVSLQEIFTALFPCGSVTGAPKIRTMEIIRELEKEERGVYTGGIGFMSPDGDVTFNVPIRTVILDGKGGGEMGIGSGIVYDSDPEAEWEECKLKGRFLSEAREDFDLIETLVWIPEEGYFLLAEHLARLLRSAAYFNYPVSGEKVADYLARLAEDFEPAAAVRVRLVLARDGNLSASTAACGLPAMDLAPEIKDSQDLPQIVFSPAPTDSQDVFLFHKTTRRQLYDRERQKHAGEGVIDVVFENERGEVTEGAISNIFVRSGDVFFTPPVSSGLLAGVFREYFLKSCPLEVREKILTRRDLQEADAVYIANSVRGLVRVSLEIQFKV